MTRLGDILDLDKADEALASREIGGIACDSRKVAPGDVFFALAGARDDGFKHVGEAAAKGAAVIVASREAPVAGAPFVRVPDARSALAHAAARLFRRQPETIVAVTGTSGKTSVAAFVRQIWASLGREAASIGTIGVVSRPLTTYGALTTPDPIVLHQTLDRLAEAGVTHLALEASSHGLDQKRLDGVRLAAGAFTNLSRDHMDYHATVEDYFAAKLRLFRELLPAGAPAIVDADSEIAPRVIDVARTRRPQRRFRRRERRNDPAGRRGARRAVFDARTRFWGTLTAHQVAIAGRFSDCQCPRCRWTMHRDRQRSGRRLRGVTVPSWRSGAARTHWRNPRRGRFRGLRAQARRARKGDCGFTSLRARSRHSGLRVRRRPRCGQTADHGGDCCALRRRCDRDRRQSALGEPGCDTRSDSCRGCPARSKSAIAPRRFGRAPQC